MHDWGNNILTIQGNGNIKTINVTKCFSSQTKRP